MCLQYIKIFNGISQCNYNKVLSWFSQARRYIWALFLKTNHWTSFRPLNPYKHPFWLKQAFVTRTPEIEVLIMVSLIYSRVWPPLVPSKTIPSRPSAQPITQSVRAWGISPEILLQIYLVGQTAIKLIWRRFRECDAIATLKNGEKKRGD